MNLEDQYCSINADIVADYLERRGMPRFAQFVRYLGDSAKATNWEADEWKRRFEEMRDRLGVTSQTFCPVHPSHTFRRNTGPEIDTAGPSWPQSRT
jgi:hypothetical protein